jgi:pyruvate dehydrogenase E2 component (dihydrolipoamide acetyltransferase)
MPALGMAQESGTLVAWLKNEGDHVNEGEAVMEIETDKTTVEIEATGSGILSGLLFQESDEVPVGQTMAWILEPGETIPESVSIPERIKDDTPVVTRSEVHPISPVAQKMAEDYEVDLSLVKPSGKRINKADIQAYLDAKKQKKEVNLIPASPKARRIAQEKSIDLSDVKGSGPGEAVLSADLFGMEVTKVAPAAYQNVSSIWSRMAEQVTKSWTSTPHFYLLREVNARSLISWRGYLLESSDLRVTYTDLLVKVVAAAIRQHPQINNFWDDGVIRENQDINVGLAVAVEDGLIVPVIHNADTLSIRQISQTRQELVERSQNKKLLLDDLQNGTFTISNLGMYGVDIFNAILNPPQAGILAVGRIADRVVPVANQPSIQPMMILSISYDHRVIDGASGARFLETLANLIEEPVRLVE